MADYVNIARQDASKYGINPNLYVRQIEVESNFDPNVRSPAGAEGIAQIMPGTARDWGVNPWDPIAALDAAAMHMAQYSRAYGDYAKALAAYNAGPGNVNTAVRQGGANWRAYLPLETQNYIRSIMGG